MSKYENVNDSFRPLYAMIVTLVGGVFGVIVGVFLFPLNIGIWTSILNVVIFADAFLLYSRPGQSSFWGKIIIVNSLLAGLNIIGLVGGVAAVFWKPRAVSRGRARYHYE